MENPSAACSSVETRQYATFSITRPLPLVRRSAARSSRGPRPPGPDRGIGLGSSAPWPASRRHGHATGPEHCSSWRLIGGAYRGHLTHPSALASRRQPERLHKETRGSGSGRNAAPPAGIGVREVPAEAVGGSIEVAGLGRQVDKREAITVAGEVPSDRAEHSVLAEHIFAPHVLRERLSQRCTAVNSLDRLAKCRADLPLAHPLRHYEEEVRKAGEVPLLRPASGEPQVALELSREGADRLRPAVVLQVELAGPRRGADSLGLGDSAEAALRQKQAVGWAPLPEAPPRGERCDEAEISGLLQPVLAPSERSKVQALDLVGGEDLVLKEGEHDRVVSLVDPRQRSVIAPRSSGHTLDTVLPSFGEWSRAKRPRDLRLRGLAPRAVAPTMRHVAGTHRSLGLSTPRRGARLQSAAFQRY